MRLSYLCPQVQKKILLSGLKMWTRFFNPISHGNPIIEIRTDASKKGWGADPDGDTTQSLWSGTESQLHINELELKEIHFTLQAFGKRLI